MMSCASSMIATVIIWISLLVSQCVMAESVTAKTYKKLTEAQELFGESQLDQAIITLSELLTDVEEDSLDEALTLQMLGYAEMGSENFDKAITYLRRSLATEKLPENVKYNVGYMVAQLHAARGEFDEALSFAAEWFVTIEEPSAAQHMFMANIYAQLKKFKESIPYAETAVKISDKPRESWYQLLTAAYFELEDFEGATRVLSRMIGLWPDKAAYWEQLASVYVIREDETHALATLKLAWATGVLTKETSIKSMVQLSVARGIPEHAARILVKAIDEKLLPPEDTYVELLANAWVNAREDEKAVDAFNHLATLTESGQPLIRVADIYVKNAQWNPAEDALKRALDLGELESAGKAWLMLGIALSEQQKFEEGFAALKKARAFDDSRKQATRWLRYAEGMRKQYEWQKSFRG
ncbi:MAG: tetratricopeptide (TPR) repeat protein [Candidatus Azotimanducaceae bacterium]|jgi:tetratricopeptide (TPR) repeat protein